MALHSVKKGIGLMTKRTICAACWLIAAAGLSAQGAFTIDRSAMSDAYWEIWNDAEQTRIDADIERNRKADCTVEIAAADGGVKGEPLVSGLFTADMRKKPAYEALDQLINHEWRTNLAMPVRDGKVSFRGFRGRYRLTWTDAEGRPQQAFRDL